MVAFPLGPDGLPFTTDDGGPIRRTRFSDVWRPMARAVVLAPGPVWVVSLPDAVDVSCASTGAYDYLSVALADPADPADPRPVGGLVEESLGPNWGLHLQDMNVVQDDLVELAARQGATFVGGRPPSLTRPPWVSRPA